MNFVIVFRAVAQAEAEEAAQWYDAQRPGLGSDFLIELERVVGIISAQPDRYSIVLGSTREAVLGRFPYCVY
jgi:hypothetical protein